MGKCSLKEDRTHPITLSEGRSTTPQLVLIVEQNASYNKSLLGYSRI
ncbi:hypothetical protein [Bacillus pumilus]|nr:hypothetical protein [Bacillus pumilus]